MAQVVVEEGKGTVGGDGFQPQGQLRQFHGHRVEVHAVQAILDDAAFPVGQGRFAAAGLGRGERVRGDLFGKELAGPQEEVAGTHRRVKDAQTQHSFRIPCFQLGHLLTRRFAFCALAPRSIRSRQASGFPRGWSHAAAQAAPAFPNDGVHDMVRGVITAERPALAFVRDEVNRAGRIGDVRFVKAGRQPLDSGRTISSRTPWTRRA